MYSLGRPVASIMSPSRNTAVRVRPKRISTSCVETLRAWTGEYSPTERDCTGRAIRAAKPPALASFMICADVYESAAAVVGAPLVLARPPVTDVVPRAGAATDHAGGWARHPGRAFPHKTCRTCPAERRPPCQLSLRVRYRGGSGPARGHRVTRRTPRARRRRSGGSPRPAPSG